VTLRVGVHGATGRMGQRAIEIVGAAPDLTLAWACGRDLPDSLDADVIVDFSTPDGLARLLAVAPCPIVSGTTGAVTLPDAPRVALLHAANFSLGVAVLARLAREAARMLPGWDTEIVEIHHSAKRDAPSGTALRLADAVDAGRGAAGVSAGPRRSGRDGAHLSGEIGLHAVRGGDVIGEHTVYLFGPSERIVLGHVASDRGLFAAGAVRCARWLAGRGPGRYTLEDVLGGA